MLPDCRKHGADCSNVCMMLSQLPQRSWLSEDSQCAPPAVKDAATRLPRLLVRNSRSTTTTREVVMNLTAAVSPEEAPSAGSPPSLLGWAQPLNEAPRWVVVSPLALAVEPGDSSQLLLTYAGEIGTSEVRCAQPTWITRSAAA